MELGIRSSSLTSATMATVKLLGLSDADGVQILDALTHGKPVILKGIPPGERARLAGYLRDASYLWQR
jgi:hypothetical protein